jgi:CBS-domain-containing membrane protein
VDIWLQKPIAVAAAIFFMSEFDCLYPPAGATALLAIVGGPNVYAQNYRFVLFVGESFNFLDLFPPLCL